MNTHLGVLADPRSPAQKEFDYKHEEIYTSAAPTYYGSKKEASFYVGAFPVDDQFSTSSCMAHGKCLVSSIFNFLQGTSGGIFVQLSSMYLYRKRINYPLPGMIPSDANMITIKKGLPVYADLPTPVSEVEANALATNAEMDTAAAQFADGKWVQFIDPTDVDGMCFVSNQLGLPLNMLFYSTYEEWSKEDVEILTHNLQRGDPTAEVSHCVTILPKSAYKDAHGKRRVIIQDSALFGGFAFRSVSEDFIKARVSETDYLISMGFGTAPAKPEHQFHADLTVGSVGPDVLALQQCLQFLGYFPDVVNGQRFVPTGEFHGLTKNAVLKFQAAYAAEVLTPYGLKTGTGYVGQSTRACLNKLFGSKI